MSRRTRSIGSTGSKLLGMTLVETMVALAILSFVAVMTWQGFSQTTRNKKIVEGDLDRNHLITAALERMTREVSMAFVSAQVNPSPALITVQTAFVGDDRSGGDRLDFTSFSHRRLYRDAHESDQNELSYFVMPDPHNDNKPSLVRREQGRIDNDPRRGGRLEVLLADVSNFEMEYLDPQSGEWLDEWDTTQTTRQPNRLPSQVKFRITVKHPRTGRETTYGTRASLLMEYALNHSVYIH